MYLAGKCETLGLSPEQRRGLVDFAIAEAVKFTDALETELETVVLAETAKAQPTQTTPTHENKTN